MREDGGCLRQNEKEKESKVRREESQLAKAEIF